MAELISESLNLRLERLNLHGRRGFPTFALGRQLISLVE